MWRGQHIVAIENGPVEIVSFPIQKIKMGGSFPRFFYVYQRVTPPLPLITRDITWISGKDHIFLLGFSMVQPAQIISPTTTGGK